MYTSLYPRLFSDLKNRGWGKDYKKYKPHKEIGPKEMTDGNGRTWKDQK